MPELTTLGLVILSAIALGLICVGLALWYAIVFPRIATPASLPAVTAAHAACAGRLAHHLTAIASEPHNLAHPHALERTARYIETTLGHMGLDVRGQTFSVDGTDVRNIEVVLSGSSADALTDTYVIGAHYDSPDDSPGANDNGTGVAALLEIANALGRYRATGPTVRLVFFVNEELPYGKTPDMGSWRYAKTLRDQGIPVRGMMALETLGYFSDRPGSQAFPWPFGHVYSNVGNFVAFVALPGGRRWVHRALRAFRKQDAFPSIGGVAPGFLDGVDLSDHWAFAEFGFPALMVTDTAPFRNPFYHTRDDLPETVDCNSLARITDALTATVADIAALEPVDDRRNVS